MKVIVLCFIILLTVLSSCKQANYSQLHQTGITLAHAGNQITHWGEATINEAGFETEGAQKPQSDLEKSREENIFKQKLSTDKKSIAIASIIRHAATKAAPEVETEETPIKGKPINKTSFITGLLSFILAIVSLFAFVMAFFTLAISGAAIFAFFTFVLSLAAFVTGVIALVSAKPGERNFIGFAIPGLVLGGIMFLLSLVLGLVVLLLLL